MATVPTIDLSPLLDPTATPTSLDAVASSIADACSRYGFLQLVGHGIDPALRAQLHRTAAEFFSLPDEEKAAISMDLGGRAWRGWFPLGEELTSGVPDDKEGLYLGTELGPDDPRVRAGLPLHGPNLFPERPAELGPTVLAWMDAVTQVGRAVLSGIAISFGLDRDWFDRWCAEPTVLFRIFHYPAAPADDAGWGVGEHTDYGLLTLLAQDDLGGLQVKTPSGWIEAPPVPGAFVCNIGDMLDRLTGGEFRSTPHRVRNTSGRDRLSFPLFFDPAFDAVIRPLPGRENAPPGDRWDGVDPAGFQGTYGDYLLGKIGKVFPELGAVVISPG